MRCCIMEEAPRQALDDSRCWCCDREYAVGDMVSLGAHPEVTVCRGCARFLNRRASAELGPRTPLSLLRRGSLALRDGVIRLELHERRRVGPVLRWLDDRLP